MNYTIYSTGADVTISTQTFTATPMRLVEINWLESEGAEIYYKPLFDAVDNGSLKIKLNNVDVINSLAIVSQLITLKSEDTGNFALLKEDWLDHKRFVRADYVDDAIKAIDEKYNKRVKDGQAYYRKKRAETVKKIDDVNDPLTETDAFIIDQKVKDVKDSVLTGDWKTAKAHLDLTVTEGAYTQAVKDEYDTYIVNYIVANY